MDAYANTYQNLLAIPVVKGIKSKGETFAGADYTTTVELFVKANGRGIQGATSHMLGQNFSKMFKINFEGKDKTKELAWQTSWGFTTRSIGAMIMIHGDDKGLVLPPRVAPLQVVIVPIIKKDSTEGVVEMAHEIGKKLKEAGVRVRVDDRENYNPGWKYAHWETKGVPIRIELGAKDMQSQQVMVCRRDTGSKTAFKWDGIEGAI